MVTDIINEYREWNRKPRVSNWERVVSDYCFAHSMAMAHRGEVYHAEGYLLNNWGEAVAMCGFNGNSADTIRYLLFEVLDKSEQHRNLILNSDILAVGFYTWNYRAYLTIRGR